VPISASRDSVFSVPYMEKKDAQIQFLSGGYVPRLCENSKCCRIRGYLDPYPIGDRGLQRILRDQILRTKFRAEFSHSLCR
jgi:hypothetical protein